MPIRIRIRNFKTGSVDPDPDPKKIGPDPQHWLKCLYFGSANYLFNYQLHTIQREVFNLFPWNCSIIGGLIQ